MKFPDQFRWQDAPHGYDSVPGDTFGIFRVPGRHANGRELKIIASSGDDEYLWEHVSVSLPDSPKKCPSWQEMCIVKDLFWEPEQAVMQIHPPASQYVNQHEGCLHLWRPILVAVPLPPRIMV